MEFGRTQEQAIRHRDGPMMVLAGPGSGKTTVITHRIKYLTEDCRINPSDILVITFTRAAAEEMKERYVRLTGAARGVSFGTFHSIFFQILKLAYRYTAQNIVRTEQQMQFIRELAGKEELELEDENEFVTSVLSEISSVKGEMIDLRHYYSKNCPDETFRRIFSGYEEQMRRSGLIDFDDMMVMCWQLFRERKDILAAWQKRYRYILIDEFQDINRLQYEIIRLIAKPENNLFIVGDDDQSIYRFRGARPEIMLGFEKDYKDAKRILLDVNYRCTAEIAGPSLRLIENNEKRFKKNIKTAGARGKNIITRVWQDSFEENNRIAGEIKQYLAAGYQYSDIAVLYRTNSGPRLLMEKLMEYNLPFRAKDTVPNLYEHWISRNILTYIKIALGSRERSDFLQIINRPNRYISRDSLRNQTVDFGELKSWYSEKDWMVDRIENLEYDLKAVSRMSPLAAVNYIRQGIGYDGFLEEYAGFRRMKPEELLETADQLKESAAGYKTYEEWFRHIEDYGEELKRQASAGKASEEDAVTLATMHGSKGLEFKIVYILDANEGVTPHSKAALDEDIEEERRLFYVAMTRAKERLHVYAVKERYHKKVEVSRFVEEYLG
ncbi:ATP-dependent helicase [[Clostridium] symbiosum]|uniref:ATP-dependent helicase n=1 Tax=Clostridium symbiosum TaxID=1512 RepID=UPI001D064140|nr:ATP-dependent helicase [[Clostridium] symbiosum]MCB6608623.1 ATP-dependent helicase [[Clostridium] symbiosum]MCB6931685.1 ATP-dependent helicase [[Clostridium] symbiosum]